MRRIVSLTVLLHEESSCYTYLDCGALCPVRPLARHPVACLAMISAFSFPGTPVWAGIQQIFIDIPRF
jgi:hypothetical protein